MELSEKIKSDINENPIILFMKGTKEMPMCGFSNQVVFWEGKSVISGSSISRLDFDLPSEKARKSSIFWPSSRTCWGVFSTKNAVKRVRARAGRGAHHTCRHTTATHVRIESLHTFSCACALLLHTMRPFCARHRSQNPSFGSLLASTAHTHH